jgi:hypothetical protein
MSVRKVHAVIDHVLLSIVRALHLVPQRETDNISVHQSGCVGDSYTAIACCCLLGDAFVRDNAPMKLHANKSISAAMFIGRRLFPVLLRIDAITVGEWLYL